MILCRAQRGLPYREWDQNSLDQLFFYFSPSIFLTANKSKSPSMPYLISMSNVPRILSTIRSSTLMFAPQDEREPIKALLKLKYLIIILISNIITYYY